MQDKALKKELRKIYEYYIEGDVIAFDNAIVDLGAKFVGDVKRVVKEMKKLRGMA